MSNVTTEHVNESDSLRRLVEKKDRRMKTFMQEQRERMLRDKKAKEREEHEWRMMEEALYPHIWFNPGILPSGPPEPWEFRHPFDDDSWLSH